MPISDCDLLTIVNSSNIKNSLFIQAELLNSALEDIFKIKTLLLAGRGNAAPIILRHLRIKTPIIIHYGSFEPWLIMLRNLPNVHLVYHNHTPLRYYWNWEPRTALLDSLTEIQLRILSKKRHWIAVSPYNLECLNSMGYQAVDYCPCIVSSKSQWEKRIIKKTKEPSMMYLGNINPSKNCIELVRTAQEIAHSMKTQIVLKIIGDIKKGSMYGNAFKESIKKIMPDKYLKLEWINKYIPNYYLGYLLSSSWLYVSTSKHEGFGLPACEAILNNTPAIYMECGGQESILNGLGKVPVASRHLFSKRVAELLYSSDRRDKLLQDQLEVVNGYALPNNLSRIKEVYKSVMKT